MNAFITRHASKITRVLEGFDRQLFRGHLLRVNFAEGGAQGRRCTTWQVFRSRKEQSQEVRRRSGKCLHACFYFHGPAFGWMHGRVQIWMPFTVEICVNDRE